MIINQNPIITNAAKSWNPIMGTHSLTWSLPSPIPSSQFKGFHFPPNSIRGRRWGVARSTKSSPGNIIAEMSKGNYMLALDMVISWGGMDRTINHIYTTSSSWRNSPTGRNINTEISSMISDIKSTHNIANSWNLCRENLGWSSVITSKFLHFLYRSIYPSDVEVPVAYDNAKIKKCLAADFYASTGVRLFPAVGVRSYSEYECYLSAIFEWRKILGWATTTDVEATIFAGY